MHQILILQDRKGRRRAQSFWGLESPEMYREFSDLPNFGAGARVAGRVSGRSGWWHRFVPSLNRRA
jgi:hypothetical protein